MTKDTEPPNKEMNGMESKNEDTTEEDAKKKQKEQTKKLKKLDGEIEEKEKNYVEYKIKKEMLDIFDKEDRIDIKERIVEVPMDGGKLNVVILGKNKFQINNGSEVIYPTTIGGDKPWYTSEWYRSKIKNTLIETCDLSKKESAKVINEIIKKVNIKTRELTDSGDFLLENIELQDILCEIRKVTVIRSEDCNIYQIHLDGKTIEMTDKELYNGGLVFCVKYLNRFLKRIEISSEEWNELFLPRILSDGILEPETEEVSSNAEIVTEKFLQYVGNKKVCNWNDIDKRKGYRLSVYYNIDKNEILISSNFINKFFQGEKITRDYKITTIGWAGHLHNKGYLVEKRTTEKIGGGRSASFWRFEPEKIEIKESDIEKESESKQTGSMAIENFKGGDNNA